MAGFFYLLFIKLLFSDLQGHSHLALLLDEVTKCLMLQGGKINFEVLTIWDYIEKLQSLLFNLIPFFVL